MLAQCEFCPVLRELTQLRTIPGSTGSASDKLGRQANFASDAFHPLLPAVLLALLRGKEEA